jgi:hypothetical protein
MANKKVSAETGASVEGASSKYAATRAGRSFNRGFVFIGVLALAAVIWGLFFRQTASTTGNTNTPFTGDIEGVLSLTPEQGHQEGFLNYNRYPPAGGIHAPHWWNAGIYEEQIPVENAVHTLEHGGVWIVYHPADTTAEEIETLRTLVRGRTCTLLSPGVYGGQNTKISAVAWGYALDTEDVNDPRIPQFIAKYERGPQSPEPGAACSGDEGTPSE